MRRASSHRIVWIAAAVSALLHVVPAGGPRAWTWVGDQLTGKSAAPESTARNPGRVDAFRSKSEIQHARRQLVTTALAARKAGQFLLGEFILNTDALDAEEAKTVLDSAEARRLLADRCSVLRDALKTPDGVVGSVTRSFSSYAYSMAVNRMSDMLLTKVGACGPTTQLIASCLYDAKKRDGLSLRYWGGVNQSGTTHVTPTWTEDGEEVDLASGARVSAGGQRVDPGQLIEAYARAHGIVPALPRSGAGPTVDAAAISSFQYPPNKDVFDSGEVPLFSERLAAGRRRAAPISGRGTARDATGFGDLSWAIVDDELLSALSFGAVSQDTGEQLECVLSPRALFVRTVTLSTPAGTGEVELLPVLSQRGLSVMARAIARYEQSAPRKTLADRMTTAACLALSYAWAAPRFSAAGFDVIARESARRGESSRKRASQYHADLSKRGSQSFETAIDSHADQWALVAFEAGEKTLLELESRPTDPSPAKELKREELDAYIYRQRRTQALLNLSHTRRALIDASAKFDLGRRMMFLGNVASLRIMNPDLEIPKTGWLPGALAAYDHVLVVMRRQQYGSDAYFDASLDVMRAAGATKSEIRGMKKQQAEVKKRLKARRMGQF